MRLITLQSSQGGRVENEDEDICWLCSRPFEEHNPDFNLEVFNQIEDLQLLMEKSASAMSIIEEMPGESKLTQYGIKGRYQDAANSSMRLGGGFPPINSKSFHKRSTTLIERQVKPMALEKNRTEKHQYLIRTILQKRQMTQLGGSFNFQVSPDADWKSHRSATREQQVLYQT